MKQILHFSVKSIELQDNYVHQCGICHTLYESKQKARECLQKHVQSQDYEPIDQCVILEGKLYYRCISCSKVYTHPKDAHQCLSKDLNTDKHILDPAQIQRVLDYQTGKKETLFVPTADPGGLEAIVSDALEGDNSKPISDIPLLKIEPIDPRSYRLPNQKPFARIDAAYECTVCRNRFFTKSEVEKCFNGHPLLEKAPKT